MGDRRRAEAYYFRVVADLVLFYASSEEPVAERRRLAAPHLSRLRSEFAGEPALPEASPVWSGSSRRLGLAGHRIQNGGAAPTIRVQRIPPSAVREPPFDLSPAIWQDQRDGRGRYLSYEDGPRGCATTENGLYVVCVPDEA